MAKAHYLEGFVSLQSSLTSMTAFKVRQKVSIMKHKFSEEIYKTLYTTNPSLAKDYFSSFPEQQKPKIHKVWPIDLKWWQHKKYDDIKKQCKFLDPS